MIAPISARVVIERKCPRCKGDSRTIRISRRRSFNVTSAARIIRFELIPAAIDAIVWMEEGAMIIPSVGNDPLASLQLMSSTGYQQSASARRSAADFPISRKTVRSPDRDKMRCVSARPRSFSSNRQPYTDPLAPVMPTTMRKQPP